jgi:hypothetical protein
MKKILLVAMFLLLSVSCFASLDVFIQDQTTRPFDLFFVNEVGSPTLVSQDVEIDQTWVVVDNIVSITPGTYLGIFSTTQDKFYFADVLSVSGTNLSLDTPFDFNFSAGDFVRPLTRDLNVDGSTECQTFSINGPRSGSIDITRLIFYIVTDTATDLGKFGDISGGLDNGIVLRKTDGQMWNIYNVKTNGEMVNLQYDLSTFDASNPGQGVYGLAGRYTFNGQDKHGVPIRLRNSSESLDLIICDDLSSIQEFRMLGAGQFVDNTSRDGVEVIPSEDDLEFKMIWTIFLIFAMGLLLAILAQYLRNSFIMTFSAVWFLLSALTNLQGAEDIFGYSVVLFFILLAALLGWHSSVMFKRFEEGKRTIKLEDD